MRTAFAYTSARILLFCGATGLLYLIGARGLLLLALALLVSGIVSYVLLSKQRDAMSGALSTRLRNGRNRAADLRSRLEEGASAEDADNPEDSADALQAADHGPGPAS
jgi:hypothetical protein